MPTIDHSVGPEKFELLAKQQGNDVSIILLWYFRGTREQLNPPRPKRSFKYRLSCGKKNPDLFIDLDLICYLNHCRVTSQVGNLAFCLHQIISSITVCTKMQLSIWFQQKLNNQPDDIDLHLGWWSFGTLDLNLLHEIIHWSWSFDYSTAIANHDLADLTDLDIRFTSPKLRALTNTRWGGHLFREVW